MKKTSWSVLDIYFIYFDKLQQKLFCNCKILEKYGIFSKTFQSFPFGDQQVTEPLIYRRVSRKRRPRKRRPQTSDLENADLENADLENTDLENADLENADLENADLENTDLENTDLAEQRPRKHRRVTNTF